MLVRGSFLVCDAAFLQDFLVKKDEVIGFFHASETWLVLIGWDSPFELMICVFIFTARTSSSATIDSLDDFARYSDDGNRETDERVAGQL